MDLIAKFKPSPQGHLYAFSFIDMLTNYKWCIWLLTKEADNMVHAHLVNVHSKFGG